MVKKTTHHKAKTPQDHFVLIRH